MKKVLKYGCFTVLGIGLIFVIISVIAINSVDSEEISDSIEKIEREKTEREPEPEKLMMTDSIRKSILKSNFRSEVDEFEKTAFHQHKLTPRYTSRNWVFPYIGENNSGPYLRFKMQYTANDWLFIKKVQFLIDGEPVDFADGNFDRDNSGGKIWEWGDLPATSGTILVLTSISESKKTTIRYTGSQYRKDRVITSNEKTVIRETLEAYFRLKDYKY